MSGHSHFYFYTRISPKSVKDFCMALNLNPTTRTP